MLSDFVQKEAKGQSQAHREKEGFENESTSRVCRHLYEVDEYFCSEGKVSLPFKEVRKRKWGEMEDDDKEKLMKVNNTISNLNKEVQQMEAQIEWFKEIEDKYIMNKAKLDKLYRNEIIDSDGELK